jgi:hypothetical protein
MLHGGVERGWRSKLDELDYLLEGMSIERAEPRRLPALPTKQPMDAVDDVGRFEILALIELEDALHPALTTLPIAEPGFENVPRCVEANEQIGFGQHPQGAFDAALVFRPVEQSEGANLLDESLIKYHDIGSRAGLTPGMRQARYVLKMSGEGYRVPRGKRPDQFRRDPDIT